jgi:DHA1 family bicyclomycin/chloramphenicol resistance-like MFS transporter
LARDLDASQSAAQLSLSLCMIGLGLGQLSAGPISDQIGRRRPLIAGVALFTVAGVACALTPTIELLLVVRLLAGIGGGAGAVIARAMVRDQFSGLAAARAFAVTAMVFGVAPVAAPLIGSQRWRSSGACCWSPPLELRRPWHRPTDTPGDWPQCSTARERSCGTGPFSLRR